MNFKKIGDKKKNIEDKVICLYDGDNIYLKNGRYGDYLRYKNNNYNIQGYLKYKKKEITELNIDDCKIIMKYPLKICEHKNINICIHIGPYGYYMKYKNKNYRIDQNPKLWTQEYCLKKL